MDITPQQPGDGDRYEAVLREHHKSARRFDSELKYLADYFRGNLPEVTRHLLTVIPQQSEAWRQEALKKYGYDLESHAWLRSPEKSIKSAEDMQGFVTLANHHGTHRIVMKLWEWFVQNGLRGEQLQAAVCESVLIAYRQRPGLAAKGIEVVEAGIPGFPQGLALSVYLMTHVVTHTSLHKNLRLRARMDELRADGESRFSRLLKELPAEVLAAYRAREAGPGDLMDLRTEAVRRLEKKPQARSEIHELAAFAEREALLKRAREAGLTAREHELLGLVVGDADRFFRNGKLDHGEAARELRVAVGTVKSLWSRIRKTLNAA